MTARVPSVTDFRFAEDAIRAVAVAVVPAIANTLLFRVKNASTYHERSQIAFAQSQFVEAQELFAASFSTFLHQGLEAELGAAIDAKAGQGTTDWQSIGLVDEDRIEESIGSKRLGQVIGHGSEPELRELDGYVCALLGLSWADEKRNPLRGDVIGTALHKAIEKVTEEPSAQKILGREIGQAMAEAMPGVYRSIIDALKKQQVRPVDMSLRPADAAASRGGGKGGGPGGAAGDDPRKAWDASLVGRFGAAVPPGGPGPGGTGEPLRSWESSILGRVGNAEPLPSGFDSESAAALLERLMRGNLPPPSARGPAQAAADLQLTELLRRVNLGAIERGELERTPFERTSPESGGRDSQAIPFDHPNAYVPADAQATELTGLMAVNLIRAHREELEQAARSKLDHMVIEVVSSLFDQILSDPRVPPQMARQIARLQLPVLRVALEDPRFFSSRRHPVRRFINRVASLACAFEEFDSGPGAGLLERTSALVGEIVKGDFDQIAVYDAKLDALQRFVDEETGAFVADSAAAATLRDKEVEWRVRQRFSAQLAAALEPLALPPFVRDFLCGAWAQAIVVATRRDGAAADAPKRLRRTAADLVASLMPKRTPEERQRFVASLAPLMAALKAGMASVGWPEAARDAFFGELVALHMASLKAPQLTDLDRNMRLRHLEAAVRTPLPEVGDADSDAAAPFGMAGVGDGAATPEQSLVEPQFSKEEEQAIGLVSEASVDWSKTIPGALPGDPPVAADPTVDATPAGGAGDVASAPDAAASPAPSAPRAADGDGDIDAGLALPTIDAGAFDAPPPAAAAAEARQAGPSLPPPEQEPELDSGLALRDHLQIGFTYQLNLKGRWEKVRLTYMSPSRTLFLFSHGAKGRETVSMTTRTLGRLCETGRMRAFETAFLVERSTERARQQLAVLGQGRTALA